MGDGGAIEAAIEAFDLEAWGLAHGARQSNPRELIMVCPACTKPKLCIRIDRRAWHCWICQRYEVTPGGVRRPTSGAGGLIDLLCLVDGLTRDQARELVLRSSPGVNRIPETLAPRAVHSTREASVLALPESWRPITVQLPWMVRRRLTVDQAREYQLGWCDSGRYASRMVFPVTEGGRLVYWQARAMWDPRPGETYIKALNPPRTDGAATSDQVLFGLEVALRAGARRVALVEGPMDTIRSGPDAVGTFGKRITGAQVGRLLAAGVREVDLMWDADAGPEIHQTAPYLRQFFDRVRQVYLPWGDPDQHDPANLRRLRDAA